MLVGTLKRVEGDPKPKAAATATTSASATASEAGGLGVAAYILIIVGGAAAYLAYNYLQGQQSKSS